MVYTKYIIYYSDSYIRMYTHYNSSYHINYIICTLSTSHSTSAALTEYMFRKIIRAGEFYEIIKLY